MVSETSPVFITNNPSHYHETKISTSFSLLPACSLNCSRQEENPLALRKTAAWRRQVWTASFQLRPAQGEWSLGDHTLQQPQSNYPCTHTPRDTVSCPWSCRQEKQSCPEPTSSQRTTHAETWHCTRTQRHSDFRTALFSSGNTFTFNTNKYTYWQPR